MIAWVFAAGMVIFVVIVSNVEKKKRWHRIKLKIREQYGKIPEVKDPPYEEIAIYWNEFNDQISDNEKLDTVTWNDLEMTEVFNRLNNTQSFAGEQMLYYEMHHLPRDKVKLLELEETISYYSTHSKSREEMQFLLWRLGKEEVSYYLPMFLNALDMQSIPHVWLYRMLQMLLVLSFLPGLITGEMMLFGFTAVIFLTNIVIYAIRSAEYEVYMESLNGIIGITRLAKTIVRDQAGLHQHVPEAIAKKVVLFDKLANSITQLQRKKKASISGDGLAMLQVYIWGATLQDFIKYNNVIQYLQGKQTEFMDIFEFIAKIDMAIAVASFRQSLPFYCTPGFVKESVMMGVDIYHPLVKEPVCNSLKMDRNCLITGSNASGKSTFIKAAALNVILAQSIHTCMARELMVGDAQVITSMAIKDDVMSGESYYIKEIKYLKRIIDSCREGRLVICIIDEILRGTNTIERIAASSSVLRYLGNANCLAMVATHDIELAEILKNKYDLYYFCERISSQRLRSKLRSIKLVSAASCGVFAPRAVAKCTCKHVRLARCLRENKDIMFDYKIREGISNSKNAINLLEYVGFPQEIITDAKNSCIGP